MSVIVILTSSQFIAWYYKRKARKNNKKNIYEPVYPEVVYNNFDKSNLNCFKFFINYGFYKFGLEVFLKILLIDFMNQSIDFISINGYSCMDSF